MIWSRGQGRRPPVLSQAELPFLARSRRLDRAFKRLIVGLTFVVVAGVVLGTSIGRYSANRAIYEFHKRFDSIMGFPVDRTAFEAQRDRDRVRGIAQTRQALERVAVANGPVMRDFLRVASLDHETAVVRWGNFDWTMALSSAVFEPDDAGRSYRLRPLTRSIWLINLTIYQASAFFEIPDTPEARRLGESVGGKVVPESVQTTNSWGCRGPEPDPNATIRGIVLGDSNMQGLLVSDDQTPPVRLESYLRAEMGVPVSILNTGVLGYSPEQYYYSLIAFYDRFKPHFVIISICANDFGDINNPENWAEGQYWMHLIGQFCRTRGLVYLGVPLPAEDTLLGRRNESIYPGEVSKIFDGPGHYYYYPMEEFITEHLSRRARAANEGQPLPLSVLFNHQYGDKHLSPIGCDLWGRLVAQRLRLIWGSQPDRRNWWKPGLN